MVKTSVLSAWAELQISSTERAYLTDVVKPHIASLIPLWLSSLQEFARLRFEPDISSSMSTNPDDNLDVVYAALNRQTLLQVRCIEPRAANTCLPENSSIRVPGSNL